MPLKINGEPLRFSPIHARTSHDAATPRAPRAQPEGPPLGPSGQPLYSGSVPGASESAMSRATADELAAEICRPGGVYVSQGEASRRHREGLPLDGRRRYTE